MGVCDDDYEISRAGSVVTLRMLRDIDNPDVIACIAQTLKTYLARRSAEHGLLGLIIDLRACVEFSTTHVMSTVSILVGEKDAVLEHLHASAVLMRASTTVGPLKKMFDRLYKPIRPFSLFMDEEHARVFVRRTVCS